MSKENFYETNFEFGEEYVCDKMPNVRTWKDELLNGKVGVVCAIAKMPHKKQIEVTVKYNNPTAILDFEPYRYITFKNEEVLSLKKFERKKANLDFEFNYEDKTTTLKTLDKTIKVKTHSEDVFDKEKGILLCLAKLFGYSYEDIKKMVASAEDKTMDFKFNVGDIVKVTNKGLTYDTYKEFIQKYGEDYVNNYKDFNLPTNGEKYLIVGRGFHTFFLGKKLYIIKDIADNVFVIDEKGIKKQ